MLLRGDEADVLYLQT